MVARKVESWVESSVVTMVVQTVDWSAVRMVERLVDPSVEQ